MPADPRAVITALNDTINAHDAGGGRRFYRADAHLVTAGGHVLDLEGLTRMLEHTMTAFPDLRMTVTRWVIDGDVAVTEEVMEGTHLGTFAGLAPTKVPVRLPMVHVTTVADDQITERIAYHDTAGILRQLRVAGETAS